MDEIVADLASPAAFGNRTARPIFEAISPAIRQQYRLRLLTLWWVETCFSVSRAGDGSVRSESVGVCVPVLAMSTLPVVTKGDNQLATVVSTGETAFTY